MKALDLFCCQGGCSKGYMDRGIFDSIVGVDIDPQPRYPYEFIQGDAMELLADEKFISQFDFIHASPPCQGYSTLKSMTTKAHPMLVEPTRELLAGTGKPWVMENVPGAPLREPLILCGTMFGLRTRRHRLFETSLGMLFPPASCSCGNAKTVTRDKSGKKLTKSFSNGCRLIDVTGNGYIAEDGRLALGIPWMTRKGLSQAIPPVYTEYIAKQMFR